MTAELKELLGEVFGDVAERLAFMFSDVADGEELPPLDGEALCARMKFVGPRTGTLAMAVPREMCPEIAANVLGLDVDEDGIDDMVAFDALSEMLNVTCGHVLTEWAGDEPVFDLTIPEVSAMDGTAWNALLKEEGTCPLLVDDSPMLLSMTVES